MLIGLFGQKGHLINDKGLIKYGTNSFLCALLFTIPQLNKKYPFRLYTFIILFLFMALRYDYGNDYMNYYNIHTVINSGVTLWRNYEILFHKLNLMIPNYYIFITVTSLFYLIVIGYLIKSNLEIKQYWFAILILLINP